MAQNTFLNSVADKNAANKPDRQNHGHSSNVAGAAAGDFTISFDNAVVTKLNTFDSLVASVRQIAIATGLK